MTGEWPKGRNVAKDEPEKSNTLPGLPRTGKETISGWTTGQGQDHDLPDGGR